MKAENTNKALRLDKYLTDMGVGSRTQVKDIIKKKHILVNDHLVTKPECKVNPTMDLVKLDGNPIRYAQMEYYMLNKPAGVVSAVKDNTDSTVIDLITTRQRKDLFPVGRLDKDTEGLLLITNDGALAHQLLSPRKHVEKTYFARVSGPLTKAIAEAFAHGLSIGDEKPTLPAKLEILRNDAVAEVLVTIVEGRFHQVKRMFQACDSNVLYLKRLSMGSLQLDETLAPGSYRALTKEELERLKNTNVNQ